jgi:hypothetical protein
MNLSEWFKAFTELGQSTNGGFTVIALIASVACWMLYRGTRATLVQMKKDLDDCNRKHETSDREIADVRRKAENIGISAASMWTIISMSGDRRGYQLPPLAEVLEGRMVIQIRHGTPESGDKRSVNTPFVYSEEGSTSG